MKCETCCFYDEFEGRAAPQEISAANTAVIESGFAIPESGYGECRRYPPVLVNSNRVGTHYAWAQPYTIGDNWCGEWRAKEHERSEP